MPSPVLAAQQASARCGLRYSDLRRPSGIGRRGCRAGLSPRPVRPGRPFTSMLIPPFHWVIRIQCPAWFVPRRLRRANAAASAAIQRGCRRPGLGHWLLASRPPDHVPVPSAVGYRRPRPRWRLIFFGGPLVDGEPPAGTTPRVGRARKSSSAANPAATGSPAASAYVPAAPCASHPSAGGPSSAAGYGFEAGVAQKRSAADSPAHGLVRAGSRSATGQQGLAWHPAYLTLHQCGAATSTA